MLQSTAAMDLPDAELQLQPLFDAHDDADALMQELSQADWRQDRIRIYGKEHNVPRLQQWYGDAPYTWSGIRMMPLPWTPTLLAVKQRVEAAAGATFNTVLLNLYRDGNDTVGWHADDERDLGDEPVIASVSLGAERDFVLRHNRRLASNVILPLPAGSLLVMRGRTQACWQHCLPRRKRVGQPRINLTFRRIENP